MNRTEAGWRTWYTVPLPNIGKHFAIQIVLSCNIVILTRI